MAAPLSQEEIDNLLDGQDSAGEGVLNEPSSADGNEPGVPRSSKSKYFGISESKPFRYRFTYRSPVLKSNSFIVDPDPEVEQDPSATIVRSLGNYAKLRSV